MGQGKGYGAQRLSDLLPGLPGLHVPGNLVLLLRIPFGIPEQWELTGKIAYGFQIGVCKAQDAVGLHERHGGKDVVGDIAAAVRHHERGDFSQIIQKFLCLSLLIGRVGVLVLTLFHAEDGEVFVLFQRHQIVLDERLRHMGGGKNTAQRMLALKLRGRADAGQHGGGHIAEKKHHVFLPVGKVLCKLHGSDGLSAAGGAPNGKDSFLRLLLRRGILLWHLAGEDALFLKVQHHCTSLSAGASDAVLSSGS